MKQSPNYLHALTQALYALDGILATVQPLTDLAEGGAILPEHKTYLSVDRTGLARVGASSLGRPAAEFVATVKRAAEAVRTRGQS